MNNWLKIAFRNILRQRKRTILLLGAIAFGFMIITLLGGFTNGVAESVKENFAAAFGGHIYISGSVVSDYGSKLDKIGDPSVVETALDPISHRITEINHRSRATGELVFGSKTRNSMVYGIDLETENYFRENIQIVDGELELILEPGYMLLAQETADRLGVQAGESILLKTRTVTGQQNVGEYTVAATYVGDSSMGVSSSYTSIEGLNSLIGLDEREFRIINLYVDEIEALDEITAGFYSRLSSLAPVETREETESAEENMGNQRRRMFSLLGIGGLEKVEEQERWEGTKFTVTNLNDMTDQLSEMVSLLNTIGLGIFLILLVIVMVGLLNSYRMVMIERTSEIGTMRAVGVQKKGIRRIFLWEGFLIALGGAAAGFLLAIIIMVLSGLYTFGSESFLSFFLRGGHLHYRILTTEVTRNLLLLCGLSVAAVSIPANAAAALKPADALRA